jgi:DNA-binding beta-propeller fold protein YncE
VLAAGLGAYLVLNTGEPEKAPSIPSSEVRPLEKVSGLIFPADLLWHIPLTHTDGADNPTPDSAAMPADVAVIDDRIYVLDTNNSRVMEIDKDGNVLQILDSSRDSRLTLQGPMAVTAQNGHLYVANSRASNVIVLDPAGVVEQIITPQVPPTEKPLRPIGIAVTAGGDIFLSDPDNHRVLRLDSGGRLLSSLGSGARDSGDYGFNMPGGLSLDSEDNLYVVDMLNYKVKKYSSSGEFLLSLGEAGDTEGTFSRPKSIAVDGAGRILVSDTLQVAVEAFESDGTYAGFIGREDPANIESASLFQAPHGLKVMGDTLYVVDRFAGLFAFRLPS